MGGTFVSHGLAAADRTTAAITDRYAPEGEAAHGSVAMRMLGFADRLLAPRLASTQRFSERAVGGAHRMGLAMPQWIYPYPWFADDLARMEMARRMTARPPATAAQVMVQAWEQAQTYVDLSGNAPMLVPAPVVVTPHTQNVVRPPAMVPAPMARMAAQTASPFAMPMVAGTMLTGAAPMAALRMAADPAPLATAILAHTLGASPLASHSAVSAGFANRSGALPAHIDAWSVPLLAGTALGAALAQQAETRGTPMVSPAAARAAQLPFTMLAVSDTPYLRPETRALQAATAGPQAVRAAELQAMVAQVMAAQGQAPVQGQAVFAGSPVPASATSVASATSPTAPAASALPASVWPAAARVAGLAPSLVDLASVIAPSYVPFLAREAPTYAAPTYAASMAAPAAFAAAAPSAPAGRPALPAAGLAEVLATFPSAQPQTRMAPTGFAGALPFLAPPALPFLQAQAPLAMARESAPPAFVRSLAHAAWVDERLARRVEDPIAPSARPESRFASASSFASSFAFVMPASVTLPAAAARAFVPGAQPSFSPAFAAALAQLAPAAAPSVAAPFSPTTAMPAYAPALPMPGQVAPVGQVVPAPTGLAPDVTAQAPLAVAEPIVAGRAPSERRVPELERTMVSAMPGLEAAPIQQAPAARAAATAGFETMIEARVRAAIEGQLAAAAATQSSVATSYAQAQLAAELPAGAAPAAPLPTVAQPLGAPSQPAPFTPGPQAFAPALQAPFMPAALAAAPLAATSFSAAWSPAAQSGIGLRLSLPGAMSAQIGFDAGLASAPIRDDSPVGLPIHVTESALLLGLAGVAALRDALPPTLASRSFVGAHRPEPVYLAPELGRPAGVELAASRRAPQRVALEASFAAQQASRAPATFARETAMPHLAAPFATAAMPTRGAEAAQAQAQVQIAQDQAAQVQAQAAQVQAAQASSTLTPAALAHAGDRTAALASITAAYAAAGFTLPAGASFDFASGSPSYLPPPAAPALSTGRPGGLGARVEALAFETFARAADLSLDIVDPTLIAEGRAMGLSPSESVAALRIAAGGSSSALRTPGFAMSLLTAVEPWSAGVTPQRSAVALAASAAQLPAGVPPSFVPGLAYSMPFAAQAMPQVQTQSLGGLAPAGTRDVPASARTMMPGGFAVPGFSPATYEHVQAFEGQGAAVDAPAQHVAAASYPAAALTMLRGGTLWPRALDAAMHLSGASALEGDAFASSWLSFTASLSQGATWQAGAQAAAGQTPHTFDRGELTPLAASFADAPESMAPGASPAAAAQLRGRGSLSAVPSFGFPQLSAGATWASPPSLSRAAAIPGAPAAVDYGDGFTPTLVSGVPEYARPAEYARPREASALHASRAALERPALTLFESSAPPQAQRSRQHAAQVATPRGAYESPPIPEPVKGNVAPNPAEVMRAASAIIAGQVPKWLAEVTKGGGAPDHSVAEQVSLLDLALVQTAAPRGVSLAAKSLHEPAPGRGHAATEIVKAKMKKKDENIEQTAREVYEEIRRIMNISRERSGGDPWGS